MDDCPPSEPHEALSTSSNIIEQRPLFLQLPPEIRLAVYDLLFDKVTAKVTFLNELKTQVRYVPRRAPAITEVCRFLRDDAFPILQQKVLVMVHAHHLRTIQQRLATQGRSTAMMDIAPILTWAQKIRFLSAYNLQREQPILASCRGLRMVTVPVNLNPRGIREPNPMDDEICRDVANLVKATIASCTGLGERVSSAEAAMTPWAGGWIRERVVVTVHINAFDTAKHSKPSVASCPCGGRRRCNVHSDPWLPCGHMAEGCGTAYVRDDEFSDSGFRWLARRIASRFRRPDPDSPYY